MHKSIVAKIINDAIARECGFPKPNFITMLKQGKSPLPLNRVEKLAKALDIDPVLLMKHCLQEYETEAFKFMITHGMIRQKHGTI
jgi:hypothetical protein